MKERNPEFASIFFEFHGDQFMQTSLKIRRSKFYLSKFHFEGIKTNKQSTHKPIQ